VYLGVPSSLRATGSRPNFIKTSLRSLRTLSESVRMSSTSSRAAPKRPPKRCGMCHRHPPSSRLRRCIKTTSTRALPLIPLWLGPLMSSHTRPHRRSSANQASPITRFLVYGPTGLGKTHLIQAIGNHFRAVSPSEKRLLRNLGAIFDGLCLGTPGRQRCRALKKSTANMISLSWTMCSFWRVATKSKKNSFISLTHLHDGKQTTGLFVRSAP
jgi:hypothetical protein